VAGKKLLVADDSLTIQKVIRLALSNEGYEIQAISDGADALQQISVFRPDLILIDVSLPTRSAFEIKRELNTMEEFENTRFILMSSAFEKIDETQAAEVKFHGRLTKPFDPAHLRQVLQEVLKAPVAAASPPPKKDSSKSSISIQVDKSAPGIRLDPPSGFPTVDAPDPTTQLKMEDLEEISPSLPEITLSSHQQALKQRQEEGISISFETRDETDRVEKTDPRGSTSGKDEIKHLTESTIRMSGLDDFDWTVNDSNLKPTPSMDDGGTGFQIRPQFSEEPAAPQGMPPISQTRPASSGNIGGNTGKFNKPSGNTGGFNRPSSPYTPPPLPEMPSAFPQDRNAGDSSFSGLAPHQLEEVIRRQVQETLAEMAQRILPEVAERVIKAEIHRLLNEKV
jgi:two-component system, cell cycle response regulator